MKMFIRISFIIGIVLIGTSFAGAAEVDELEEQISEHGQKIGELEEEIKQYEQELEEVGREKQSLEGAIRTIDIARNRLSSNIQVTENKIYSTNLQIREIDIDIGDTERKIEENRETISALIRKMDEIESASLVEIVLVHNSLNEFSDQIEVLRRLQSNMQVEVNELRNLKKDLEGQRSQSEKKKGELGNYRTDLVGQKRAVDINKEEKDKLLTITENEESQYQELLAEKRAEKEAFELELRRIESQLQYRLDPNRIPSAGEGVLLWPLDSITITQRFGYTAFAQTAAYNGNNHNGVDFRAAPGTPVLAALSGTIQAINQGSAPGCQYGKWILVKHHNGLSTLYAHLSDIAVSEGNSVSTRDIIGYSGSTGYALGPHLHFTVYVSDAVSFRQYECRSGAVVNIPVSPFNGYLDPLSYL